MPGVFGAYTRNQPKHLFESEPDIFGKPKFELFMGIPFSASITVTLTWLIFFFFLLSLIFLHFLLSILFRILQILSPSFLVFVTKFSLVYFLIWYKRYRYDYHHLTLRRCGHRDPQYRWESEQVPPHDRRGTHLYVAYLGQVQLTDTLPLQVKRQPMSSKLKVRTVHAHVVYSIRKKRPL